MIGNPNNATRERFRKRLSEQAAKAAAKAAAKLPTHRAEPHGVRNGMANRLQDMIVRLREKEPTIDPADLAKCDEAMAIGFTEHFDFQTVQSHAFAEGVITAAEAQTVYNALGEIHTASNGGWDSSADTATKVAVTKLISELLTRAA